MKKSKQLLFACGLMLAAWLAVPEQAFGKDDFGQIVKHIETQYHVHRQHRWVFGMAGFAVKVWHVGGVKSLKCALFENQRFSNTVSDTRFDEVVRAAMESGWQPMVQTWDRRSGERTYIYAQDLGKDLKLLVVNLESTEAVVLQVKVDPARLTDFVKEAGAGRRHSNAPVREEPPVADKEQVEVAASQSESWDGICLVVFDADSASSFNGGFASGPAF